MNRHFSYLLDDESNDFFQKVSCEAAERYHGVPVPKPESDPMRKEASAQSSFEKIASRLDRDIGILKTAAGSELGIGLGMNKQANAYLDVLWSECDLSPEEYGEIFDKVAAEAIQTDLDVAYQQFNEGIDPSLHFIAEQELAKLGYEMAKYAQMEKEAGLLGAVFKGIWRGVRRGLGRGSSALSRGAIRAEEGLAAGSGLVRSEARAIGRGAKAIGRDIKGAGRTVRRKYRNFRMSGMKGTHENILARRARLNSGPKPIGRRQIDMRKERLANLAKQEKRVIGRKDKYVNKRFNKPHPSESGTPGVGGAKPPKPLANTTASDLPSAPQKLEATSTLKTQKNELGRGAAKNSAREAANTDNVIKGDFGNKGKGPKGTGTDGPNPVPNVPKEPKPVSPAAAETAGASPGVIEKLRTGGWNSLTKSEKLQAAGGAYLIHRTLSND